MNFRRFLEDLEQSEGFEGMPYDDTEGFATIGIGTKLPLSLEEARLLAEHRARGKRDELMRALDMHDIAPRWSFLPELAQEVLLDMSYQMGVAGTMKFRKMLAAMAEQVWATAARELMDSRYARQTPNRAARNERKLLELQESER